ncbi:hypothetical protein M9Y10_024518 [Tritrichomonas musculus]|uniref:DUF3447 domain-containing protein n=1 Tax=Tritrichomonas musculus TaxID=1915356 RepID=A0ABR2HC77_9EUKA
MSYQEFTEKMKEFQNKFLAYLENEDNSEENYQNLISFFNEQKFGNNKDEIKLLLYTISNISKNHFRGHNFSYKVEQILLFLKNFIQDCFSNSEIFNFFKGNNVIILFLLEENILFMNDSIYLECREDRSFINFFRPEIKSFLKEENIRDNFDYDFDEINDQEEFDEKRKKGENDNEINEIIRNDSIEEFIVYVNKNQHELDSKVTESIYETNHFLIKNDEELTLIEYAAFFGAVQIFRYLYLNGVQLKKSLWMFAIHGNNPELIEFLIENKIKPEDETYENCLKEAIKCHHNCMAEYIRKNLMNKHYELRNLNEKIDTNLLSYSFHYYNFSFISNQPNNHFIFYYAIKFDYLTIVDLFIKTKKIDVLETINEIFS